MAYVSIVVVSAVVFFFNDTATTEIYTLSLHAALPILWRRLLRDERPRLRAGPHRRLADRRDLRDGRRGRGDRKSTRLNSSHANISYAVFCLKKKKKKPTGEEMRQDDGRLDGLAYVSCL